LFNVVKKGQIILNTPIGPSKLDVSGSCYLIILLFWIFNFLTEGKSIRIY